MARVFGSDAIVELFDMDRLAIRHFAARAISSKTLLVSDAGSGVQVMVCPLTG